MKYKNVKRYSVYEKKTDFPVIVNGTADECARAMGVALNTFRKLASYKKSDKWLVIDEKKLQAKIKEKNKVMTIGIKYFEPDLKPLEKIKKGDWIDLRAAERVEMKKGDYYLIRLGVGMILPNGYEAHVLPRSSTPKKFGIMSANSMGIIDNSYSGDADEWKFPAVAIRDTVIEKGDRIAQFRIVENQPSIEFMVLDRLNEDSRGGIGSTGTR